MQLKNDEIEIKIEIESTAGWSRVAESLLLHDVDYFPTTARVLFLL